MSNHPPTLKSISYALATTKYYYEISKSGCSVLVVLSWYRRTNMDEWRYTEYVTIISFIYNQFFLNCSYTLNETKFWKNTPPNEVNGR